ncbi:hypothetical protein Vau01_059870 [Virgisporangium aurantiacum]|uniref:Uncharacterized protein n=1 Tax=Virgisporangium aurantiacum TaxID=175570 RepID=A0A8J3Z6S1_9ACTN|nr:hypothetical protein Vau01_059870 [Virgisporangium aurantiacum]
MHADGTATDAGFALRDRVERHTGEPARAGDRAGGRCWWGQARSVCTPRSDA